MACCVIYIWSNGSFVLFYTALWTVWNIQNDSLIKSFPILTLSNVFFSFFFLFILPSIPSTSFWFTFCRWIDFILRKDMCVCAHFRLFPMSNRSFRYILVCLSIGLRAWVAIKAWLHCTTVNIHVSIHWTFGLRCVTLLKMKWLIYFYSFYV